MKKNIGVIAIIAVVVAAFIGLVTWSLNNKQANEVHYNDYDLNSVITANDDNGQIADHVKGNPDAPVLLFEYADYQCPGCASMNPRINKLLDEYGDQLGLVYRSFLLSYHKNGTAAASAAEAAGLQGYWKPYADMLFANQATWENATADQREDVFTDLFANVTEGKGDIEKFKSDMASEQVKAKIDFDMGIGKKINVSATPSLYLDGEKLDLSDAGTESEFLDLMRKIINEKLKSAGIEPTNTKSTTESAETTDTSEPESTETETTESTPSE